MNDIIKTATDKPGNTKRRRRGASDLERSDYIETLLFLNETWSLSVTKITKLTEGSAKCFAVESKTGKYFFKVYQEKFDLQTLSDEITICDFLTKKGFCVSVFIPSKKGRYIEEYKGRLCTLQHFIDGITYHKFGAPKNLLYDATRVLARLNTAMEELPVLLPLGFDDDWFSNWSRDAEIEKNHKLLARLNPNDENYDRIARDIESKCNLLDAFDATAFPFASLTSENSHGDYNVLQLIFASDRVKAVIDFTSCSKVPVCWELIRFYSLSSEECISGKMDTNDFVGYLKEYLKIRRISKFDLELMPYFYLFTLLRSAFGYNGYIDKKSAGLPTSPADLKTLDFAFWRTDACRWLFEHADLMSSEIKKAL